MTKIWLLHLQIDIYEVQMADKTNKQTEISFTNRKKW